MTHHYGNPRSPYFGVPIQDIIEAKRQRRMDSIDKMSPEVRALVHQYGWTVVKTLLELGIRKPAQIKHIVETILDEFSPTRGTYSQQGVRGAPIDGSAA